MTDLNIIRTLAFGMPGWQEIVLLLVCCGMPLFIAGVVLFALYKSGAIGNKKDQ